MTMVRALPILCLTLACAESPVVLPSGAVPARPAVADDDLLAMVPAEADLVLWADMAKLRNSPWTRESFAKVAEANSGDDRAAFDQIRDVDRVVFAMIPTLQDGASVLVAQGKFDSETMRRAFAGVIPPSKRATIGASPCSPGDRRRWPSSASARLFPG